MTAMAFLRRLNPLLYVLACLAAVPVILFRCFAFLYFASTASNWALVPALALAALIVVSRLTGRLRIICALVLLAWYGCSLYFDGWHTVTSRLAEGSSAPFEVTEAALIVFLAVQCLLPFAWVNMAFTENK